MRGLELIVNGFHDAYHAPVWQQLFARHSIAGIEMIIGDEVPPVPHGIAVRSHRYFDLSMRADYGVPIESLPPIDATLLGELAEVERTFVRMADRLELVEPTPLARRKTLFLRHVRYWSHVLSTRKVDAALFSNIPHETFDFVLYELCRRRGIPTLCFHQTQVEDTFLAFEDWRDPLPGASERLRSIQLAGPAPHFGLQGRFLQHLQRQTAAEAVPFYMREPARAPLRRRIKTAIEELGPIRGWPNQAYLRLRSIRQEERSQALRRAYDRLARLPDLEVPFVYAPLHYQPELTTCPLAGDFVDQERVVQLLSANVPAGIRVFVKEHPKQTAVSRTPELYTRLAALPNVTLVPRSTDTYRLIERSRAVATCTGTAGWEALFRGKPVLMFGSYLYQYARGVHRVATAEDLAHAFSELGQGRGVPTLQDTACFLALLAERSHEGYVDGVYRAVSTIDDRRSAEHLAEAVCAWMAPIASGLRPSEGGAIAVPRGP